MSYHYMCDECGFELDAEEDEIDEIILCPSCEEEMVLCGS